MLLNDKQLSVMRSVIHSFLSEKKTKDLEEIFLTMLDNIYMDITLVDEDKLPKYHNKEKLPLSPEDILNKRITLFTRIRLYSYYSDIKGFMNDDYYIKHNYRNTQYNNNKSKRLTGKEVKPRHTHVDDNKENDTNTIHAGVMDKTIKEDFYGNKYSKRPLSRDPLYLANPKYANWLSKRKLPDNNDNYILYLTSSIALLDRKEKDNNNI